MELRRLVVVQLISAACAGCAGGADKPNAVSAAPPSRTHASGATQEAPMAGLVRNAADVTTHDGKVVRAVGTYEVQNIAPRRVVRELPDGGTIQSSKVVRLKLEDESGIRLWIRPE